MCRAQFAAVCEALKQYAEGAELCVYVINHESKLGMSHPASVAAAQMLGLIYARTSYFVLAEKMLRQAMESCGTQLDEYTVEMLRNLRYLGMALEGQGRWDEAFAYFESAASEAEKHLGAMHPETRISIQSKVKASLAVHKQEEAGSSTQ